MKTSTKDNKLYALLGKGALSLFILIFTIYMVKLLDNEINNHNIITEKKKNKVELKKETDTEFSIDSVAKELRKYKVKHIDIAIAQFLLETGYLSNKCSDIICLGNNLFGMKYACLRPNVIDGIFSPTGGGRYAFYTSWQRSVLDYALFQAHFINNKNFNRENWFSFISSKYSSTKHYGLLLQKLIKTQNLLKYK